MRFSRLNLFPCWRLAACLAAFLLAAGCVTHKTVPPAPVIYPPAPEAALQELRGLPPGPYDRLEIITIAAEAGPQLDGAIQSARQSAAQKGANALVVLQNTEFRQKVGKRTLRVRRTTYLAIHRR